MSATVYLSYFGLKEPPFSITPDPRYVYLSPRHEDALAHLLYGVGQGGSGGFIQLTGEVGTGKTTLCRTLLEQTPEGVQVALILNPVVTPEELVAGICDELRISGARQGHSLKARVDALNHYLLDAHARGERVVVVIDEAQNLSVDALEQVRLLTNLETHQAKLLQIILLGQPELRELLARPQLRQLAQRITARFHLTPLGEAETAGYIRHRMAVAGAGSNPNPFSADAMRRLHRLAGGIPRVINIIADRALTAAYAQDSRTITPKLISLAAAEVQGEGAQAGLPWSRIHSRLALLGTACLALVLAGLLSWTYMFPEPEMAISAPVDTDQQQVISQARSADTADRANETTPGPASIAAEQLQSESQAEIGVAQPEPDLADDWWREPASQAFASMAQRWLPWAEDATVGDSEAASEPGGQLTLDPAVLAADLRTSCELGRAAGFACVELSGNWQRIRRLGLPVLLRLSLPRYDEDTTADSWLALVGMDDQQAQIGVGAELMMVSRQAVEDLWLGDYSVVWPQSEDWPRALRSGREDEAVATVKALAAVQPGAYDGVVDGSYGEDFARWVQSFQGRHGLRQDGVVGDTTMLHLLAGEIDQPRLDTQLVTEAAKTIEAPNSNSE